MEPHDYARTAALLGAALVGGMLFAFSAFVMRALGRLPAPQGIAAMQAINVAVLRALVFVPLFGTIPAGLAAAWLMPGALTDPGPATALAGTLLYAIGCVVVTGTRNVPWNDRLAAADPETAEAASLWRDYLVVWTRWNHLRVLACSGAVLLFGVAAA